jgi:hypothetical protein
MAFIIVLLAIATLLFFAGSAMKKGKKELISKGFDVKETKKAGELIGGHPDIDKELKNAQLALSADSLAICNVCFSPKGFISKSSITNVKFEDATTFGQRISAGRVLLTGVFALAWKKKTKTQNAYMIIEWNDGRFDHATSFLFEGHGSTGKANALRNWLIKGLR